MLIFMNKYSIVFGNLPHTENIVNIELKWMELWGCKRLMREVKTFVFYEYKTTSEIPLHYYINCMQHKHELNPYNLHSIKSYWKNFLPAFQQENLTMIITGFLNEIIFIAKHVLALELLKCGKCRSYTTTVRCWNHVIFP